MWIEHAIHEVAIVLDRVEMFVGRVFGDSRESRFKRGEIGEIAQTCGEKVI